MQIPSAAADELSGQAERARQFPAFIGLSGANGTGATPIDCKSVTKIGAAAGRRPQTAASGDIAQAVRPDEAAVFAIREPKMSAATRTVAAESWSKPTDEASLPSSTGPRAIVCVHRSYAVA